MNRRYRLFAETETSGIKEYNKDYAPEHHVPKIPYIVVLVDEYSALVEGNKGISTAVLSIGQLARACGIHMIIATQAPRSTIITGSIKANLPTKIALLTGSSVDSVNILGTGGAEKLLGNGDMLISTPVISTTGLTRVQGAFVDNKEIKRVAGFYKTRYATDYDPAFLTLHEESKQEVYDGNVNSLDKANDDKYEMVKEFAMSMDYCSISKITRNFGFGFNRAGKIFEQLKADGILDNDPNGSSAKGTRVIKRSDPSGPSEDTGSFEQTAVDYTKKGD
jgi:DNA segregation ATPase FtsK/SpoIIIE, S-DNA-T family